VANIPGAVPRTSTQALVNATLPYCLSIAGNGLARACGEDEGLLAGLNCFDGRCTFAAVAEAHRLPYRDPSLLLGG